MGGKRVAKFQTKKRVEVVYGDDDRISHLPDDILVDIISLLSLKEAVCTSVLSSRWHNLWKHIYRLNFDPHSSLQKGTQQGFESCKEKRETYVKWVNSVLRKHKAAILKDFVIRLRLSRTFQKDVNRWINFAIVRHVQRLELDLTTDNWSLINCSLPQELLTQNTSSEIDFKFLKILCLKSVDVTEEDMKFFQSKCPMLEELVVDRSLKLVNVEVCGGPSLVLKHLELTRCYDLKSVKVSTPNLTLLSIHGCESCLKSVKITAPNLTSLTLQKVESLFLENVLRLVEVSICRAYSQVSTAVALSAFACCGFQLEILTVEMKSFEETFLPTILQLPKLKKLVVFVMGDELFDSRNRYPSDTGLTNLMKAAPNLREFVLNMQYPDTLMFNFIRYDNIQRFSHRHHLQVQSFIHQQLKVFKFCGYCGVPNQVEVLKNVIEKCVALEKVIIEPRYDRLYSSEPIYTEEFIKEQVVKRLKEQVPQQIELVIL
ncbi:hypothetical protein ABFX02_05G068400 [Erythranthe guttata]